MQTVTKFNSFISLPITNACYKHHTSKFTYFAESDVKTIFQNLRTQYRRELAKVKKSRSSGSGTDDLYQPKWQYYIFLEFLQPVTALRHTVSNLQVNLPDPIFQTFSHSTGFHCQGTDPSGELKYSRNSCCTFLALWVHLWPLSLCKEQSCTSVFLHEP